MNESLIWYSPNNEYSITMTKEIDFVTMTIRNLLDVILGEFHISKEDMGTIINCLSEFLYDFTGQTYSDYTIETSTDGSFNNPGFYVKNLPYSQVDDYEKEDTSIYRPLHQNSNLDGEDVPRDILFEIYKINLFNTFSWYDLLNGFSILSTKISFPELEEFIFFLAKPFELENIIYKVSEYEEE